MTRSKLLHSIVSFLLTMCIAVASFADDLEIYLGVADNQVTYNPNVLFIMDTSGSMTNKDGGSETRMLRGTKRPKSSIVVSHQHQCRVDALF